MATTYTWGTRQRARKRVIQVQYPGKHNGRTRDPNEVSCKNTAAAHQANANNSRKASWKPRLLKLQQEVNNETKYKEPVIKPDRITGKSTTQIKAGREGQGVRVTNPDKGMKNRGSVSRFWEGGKRGSVEQQNKERRNQSEHSDEDYGSTATHSRQGKFYGKGGGETGRRQAE